MPRYLISFDDGSMDHIPEEDWPAVGEAAHGVVILVSVQAETIYPWPCGETPEYLSVCSEPG